MCTQEQNVKLVGEKTKTKFRKLVGKKPETKFENMYHSKYKSNLPRDLNWEHYGKWCSKHRYEIE